MNNIAALLDSIWTVVVLILFTGIVLWAYSGRRKADFDAAAQLPLNDECPERSESTSSSEKNSG